MNSVVAAVFVEEAALLAAVTAEVTVEVVSMAVEVAAVPDCVIVVVSSDDDVSAV